MRRNALNTHTDSQWDKVSKSIRDVYRVLSPKMTPTVFCHYICNH